MSMKGRVSFVAAAFLFLLALTGVLERMGVSASGLWAGVIGLVGFSLGMIGWLSGSMRLTSFFLAERELTPFQSALSWITLIVGFLLIQPAAWFKDLTGPTLLCALVLGFLLILWITGPLLRRVGTLSLVDVLVERFPSSFLRAIGVFLFSALLFLLAAYALEEMIIKWEVLFFLKREIVLRGIGFALILMILPGGLRALLWGSVAVGALIFLTLSLPFIFSFPINEEIPKIWMSQLSRLGEIFWRGEGQGKWDIFSAFALSMGFSILPPLLCPSIGLAGGAFLGSSLRKVGFLTGGGGVLLVFLVLLGDGQLFSLQGRAVKENAVLLGMQQATLLSVLMMAAGAALYNAAVMISHDGFYRLWGWGRLASQRLAFTRLVFIGLVMGEVFFLSQNGFGILNFLEERAGIDSKELVALAGALFFPLILLLFCPQATLREACLALGVSLGLIGLHLSGLDLFHFSSRKIGAYFFISGISGIVAFVISLLRPYEPSSRDSLFVKTILYGSRETLPLLNTPPLWRDRREPEK